MTTLIEDASAIRDADVKPVGGRVGAVIENIRLSEPLSDATVAHLETLLARHKVLFFRDQQDLDDAGQEAFGARFGAPFAHPTQGALKGTSSVLDLDTRRAGTPKAGEAGGARADQWHTDITFLEAYPRLSILRSVVAPESGGDTVFSNTVAAYESLPEPLRALADRLWAVHSNAYDYASVRPHATAEDQKQFERQFTSTVYETEHPVVRVLANGERTLLLGNFVQRFVGINRADFHKLFALLQDHVQAQENTVRWRWRAGDVTLFDNTATQHYAVNDYGDQHRVVRRVTIEGDAPVSVDGRRSRQLTRYAKPAASIAAE